MVWWITLTELRNEQGEPSGKWRLLADSDEDGEIMELYNHEHNSAEEA